MQGCGTMAPVDCKVLQNAVCFFLRMVLTGCSEHDFASGTLGRCLSGHCTGNAVERGVKIHLCVEQECLHIFFWCDLEKCQVAQNFCKVAEPLAVIYQAESGMHFKEVGANN